MTSIKKTTRIEMDRGDDEAVTVVHGFSNEIDAPSYEVLNRHDLLTRKYRVNDEKELDVENPNSTRSRNLWTSCLCFPLCCIINNFEVPNGSLKLAYDGRGNYVFYGPGVHQVIDPFYSLVPGYKMFGSEDIVFGDRTIVTVPQGSIGYCTEFGHPVLLPPGMHHWRSPTLKFERMIDVDDPVIILGPWTLLTIDQGYMAVTQDNGKQVILEGGAVYLLTHKNWKFETFVSTKIQTDTLTRIEASSADNVIMLVDATVLWRIKDVNQAVLMSAETMSATGKSSTSKTEISHTAKLRNDVIKQALASLSFFIGTINFSDSMAAAGVNKRTKESQSIPVAQVESILNAPEAPEVLFEEFNLYNNEKLHDAVVHANEVTERYGVEIISINIISAIPKDNKLQASLAAGAVAAAEAQMMETSAQGKSRAMKIQAVATANQTMIIAQADADADVVRAEGAKKAADLLATNPVSVELSKIRTTGEALAGKGNNASFFFGADPKDVSQLLSNSNVVKGAK